MNKESAKAQMRKGVLDYCVMLLLGSGSLYAADLIAKLQEAHLIVVEGTIYPLLSRLKNEGLLSYEWRESKQGPPRKYYALTAVGRRALADADAAWSELTRSIDLIKLKSQAFAASAVPTNGGNNSHDAGKASGAPQQWNACKPARDCNNVENYVGDNFKKVKDKWF